MPDPNPYQVLGPSVPAMLGREALLGEIDNHLLQPSPDHVSVVGPKHYGKSVLLWHVARSYGMGLGGYTAASYVDLRRSVPASDQEFMRRFATEIRTVLWAAQSPLADSIKDDADHEDLGLVFDGLDDIGGRLLAVLDGFDYALVGTGLTRDLWDQLRTLAQRSSLRLVTGSRRPLSELCQTEETRTSDFWEIFYDAPVRVGALDDGDLEAFLKPLRDAGCELDERAQKEFANWTGGVPLLVVALLQKLWEDHRGKHCSKPEIDQAAVTVLAGRRQLLDALWEDCDEELRSDIDAMSRGDVPLAELADRRRRTLLDRGFGRESRNRMRGSCRLMQRHAQDQAPAVADLKRLLGTAAGFGANVQSLLRLRLDQVSEGADEELRNLVSGAISNLAPVPGHALIWVRSIAERALRVVWEAEELPTDGTLPANWTEDWNNNGVHDPLPQGNLPLSPGQQCRILRLATGTQSTARRTQFLTKPTFLLLDHLQSVGNFGQHRADAPEVTVGFAAAVLSSAISLVECLARDLGGATGPNR